MLPLLTLPAPISPPIISRSGKTAHKSSSQIERITDHVYRIGTALVDTKALTFTCPGSINMDSGSVEYLAVTPNGKTYESLLRLDVNPYYLQVGLLLLGCKPRNVLLHQGDPRAPQGSPVKILIRWREADGEERTVRAESLLMEATTRNSMPLHPWVFTGSRIVRAGFEAELSGSLVAVWHDPASILDNPMANIQNDWVVNPKRCPPRGTSIRFLIQAIPHTLARKGK